MLIMMGSSECLRRFALHVASAPTLLGEWHYCTAASCASLRPSILGGRGGNGMKSPRLLIAAAALALGVSAVATAAAPVALAAPVTASADHTVHLFGTVSCKGEGLHYEVGRVRIQAFKLEAHDASIHLAWTLILTQLHGDVHPGAAGRRGCVRLRHLRLLRWEPPIREAVWAERAGPPARLLRLSAFQHLPGGNPVRCRSAG